MAKLEFISNEIKNFLAFGNAKTKLDLNSARTTAITAENGSGKTALTIDGIFFGLFGETYRSLKKDQIPNSINMKNCVTETMIRLNGKDEVGILRGINPDVFNVFVNGVSMWDDLKRPDRQKALEKYLGIDKNSITNQILISESSQPFMQMDGPTRKTFVEKMLNMEFFDEIHKEVKEETKRLKPKVSEKEIELRSKKEMLDRLISVRADQSDGWDPKEIEVLQERIQKGQAVVDDLRKKAEEDKTKYETEKAEYDAVRRKAAELEGQLTGLRSILSKFDDSTTCPTCNQALPDVSGKHDHRTEQEERIRVLEKELEDLLLDTKTNEIEIRRNDVHYLIDRYTGAKDRLEGLKTELSNLDRKKPSETIDTQILEVTDEFDSILSEKDRLDEEYADILELDKVLKSGVAKAPLISEYIPFFNLRVNEYLEKLGLPILLELDASFKESVRSRFRQNFSYESFSAGQQARINFAIMMTWRDISKKLSSVDSNLLIIDEFGSRLDDAGVEAVSKCLSEIEGTNTICIGPRELIGEFDRKITIKTVSNFAVMEEK